MTVEGNPMHTTAEIFGSMDNYLTALEEGVADFAGADEAHQIASGIATSRSALSYASAQDAALRVGWPRVLDAAREVASAALAKPAESIRRHGLRALASAAAREAAGRPASARSSLAAWSPKVPGGAFFVCAAAEKAPDTLTGTRATAFVAFCDREGRWSMTDGLDLDDALVTEAMSAALENLLPMAALGEHDITYAPVPTADVRATLGWDGGAPDARALARCLFALEVACGGRAQAAELAPAPLRARVEEAFDGSSRHEAPCGLDALEASARTASSCSSGHEPSPTEPSR